MQGSAVTYGELIGTECGRGPTTLFLHGGLLNRTIFFDLMSALRPNRRCIAIDLPGFGASPPLETSRLSLPHLASAVGQAVKAIDRQEPVDVVGLSLGGGVAVELAHAMPESVHTLCLIGVGGLGRPSNPSGNGAPENDGERNIDHFAVQFSNRMLTSHASEEIRESVVRAVKSTQRETISALTELLKDYPDVSARARDLHLPIMVLCGENDMMVSYDHLKGAFNGAQNVVVRVVKNAGHLVPMEAADELAKELLSFWTSQAN